MRNSHASVVESCPVCAPGYPRCQPPLGRETRLPDPEFYRSLRATAARTIDLREGHRPISPSKLRALSSPGTVRAVRSFGLRGRPETRHGHRHGDAEGLHAALAAGAWLR